MLSGLRESLTHDDLTKLREAMDWVIPPDSSTGAGTDAGVARLLDLIDSQDPSVAAAYRQGLAKLGESDVADASNAFAALFLEHVRDVYYGSPDTGAWADIGFNVTDH